jgi:hypothetical protein
MSQRIGFILATLGCAAAVGLSPMAASASVTASPQPRHRVGLAGYHLTVGRRTRSVSVRGNVTVPSATCSRVRSFQLQMGAGFTSSGSPVEAIVVLRLKCHPGGTVTGNAELVAGFNARIASRALTAGETLHIWVIVGPFGATARLIYPDHKRVAVSAPGGRPVGADFALTLPNSNPPRYSPVSFVSCSVNDEPLSDFSTGSWESVIKGTTTVDGLPSSLTNKKYTSAFTITY